MGSCFSSQSQPINKPIIVKQSFDRRTESSFCAAHCGLGAVPYGNKVFQNNDGDATDHNTDFDCYCSATTTAITLLKQGEDLTIAQIAESGAVLATRDNNNALIPVRLTLNRRRSRRLSEPEPRNRNDDQYIVSMPFITRRRITDRDEFVVLASGGVLDVLSKEDVVTIVANCPRRSDAAQALVNATIRAWIYKYSTSEVDDCAVACLFLNPTTDSIQASS
ncbi:probable protein phosphatase 2C 18 [Salvia hispanica]|uniref:probable protein phosphatase 2C 18 n=1 Tax=Salvia hispanica TaxID=49212 RepID=UPI0020093AEF|nr:probable protein phosphatase 2C 18 [Salvia hispanica]